MTGTYRIRWAIVAAANGRAPMCIAERRKPFLWTHIWWPVGEWRHAEEWAERDIIIDRDLRQPLPPIKIREFKE